MGTRRFVYHLQTLKRPGPQWKLKATSADQSLNWPGAPWKLKATAGGLPKPNTQSG
ncbi:MAG: hypothetical protein ACK56F_23790 [bacterium]